MDLRETEWPKVILLASLASGLQPWGTLSHAVSSESAHPLDQIFFHSINEVK